MGDTQNPYMIKDDELHDVPLNSTSYDNVSNAIEIDENDVLSPVYAYGRSYVPMSPQYVPHKGLVKYSAALKHLIPVRRRKKTKDQLKIDNAGLFSLITFSWLSKYIYLAYKRGLTADDIPLGSPLDTCDLNSQRLEMLWQRELTRRGPVDASFGHVIWQFCRTRIIISSLVFSLSCIMGFLSPIIFMRKLLEYCESEETEWLDGIVWALALTLSELMRTLFFALYWGMSYRTGGRLRSACLCMLYKKTLRLSTLGHKTVGELVNLYGNDGQRIFSMVVFGPMVIGGPMVAVCGTVYIYYLLGPWALMGMFTFILFYPVQYCLSRLTGYYRTRTVKITDKRVNLMTEILKNIKLIKMYAWELYFQTTISDIRNAECSELKKSTYCQSFTLSMAPTFPVIAAIVTFISHVLSGGNLTAAQAFPITIILISQLRQALNNVRFSTETVVDGCISQARIQDVLLLEETITPTSRQIDKSQAVCVSNGTFVWDVLKQDKNVKKKQKKTLLDTLKRKSQVNEKEIEKLNKEQIEEILRGVNFSVTKGSLVGLCGAVGSGKSSLLLACMGQMKMLAGQLCRTGTTAYVTQQAWIINATLRDNILFGEPFDAKKYYNVIYSCALTEDINLLPGGDETEIGERGVNLSGGQKQRVALARALYSDRDIYLLDDPLSAVDSQVSAHIFDKCIKSALEKKSVVLVTHHVQYLQQCDEVFVLKDGRVLDRGTHPQLLQSCQDYNHMIQAAGASLDNNTDKEDDLTSPSEQSSMTSPAKTNNNEVSSPPPAPAGAGKQLTVGEVQHKGEVQPAAYHSYIQAAGGFLVSFIVVTSILLNVGSNTFSSWWLAVWIKAGSGNTTVTDPATNQTHISNNILDNSDLHYYIYVYAGNIGVILLTSLIRGVIFTLVSMRASRLLHNNLLNKIMSAPMRYFEATPIGRIQNVFSRDFDEVDARLPNTVETLLQNLWSVLFSFLFISLVFPWFIIPLVFLAVLYYFIAKVFRVAVRDLKRLENISRAPIFSFVTSTTSGLTTIHAFNKENEFLAKFTKIFDENATTMFMSYNAMRWMAARLDSVSVVIQCITAFMAVFLKDQVAPALAGLALSYAAHISGLFQYTIRLMSETETRFISVERIQMTAEGLEKEGTKGNYSPPHDWPAKGAIRFNNVTMRYSPDTPEVLRNVTFSVKHGEKLGVVGRTGAGKSSLVAAMFRLVELSSGKISVDGVDISAVELSVLRSRLSVIAQDPVLFAGTFRSNLDTFNLYTDEQLWDVLKKTKLDAKVDGLNGKLQAVVGENGENLSVGERQLLCLARALLRGNKILVLDEATAAIDPETELAIQTTIDNEFLHCTVITIAHRLTTVTGCNRVLVLDQGTVLELDNPINLMSNPDSEFSKMAAASGLQALGPD